MSKNCFYCGSTPVVLMQQPNPRVVYVEAAYDPYLTLETCDTPKSRHVGHMLQLSLVLCALPQAHAHAEESYTFVLV